MSEPYSSVITEARQPAVSSLAPSVRVRALAIPGWAINLALLAVLLVATMIPRAVGLDRLVTPDEPLWLARSANFYEGLVTGDLDDTYQFVHPGVTVMWGGMLGYVWKYPDFPDDAGGQVERSGDMLPDILAAHDRTALGMLASLRLVLTLFSALALGAAFLCAIRLVGRPAAFAGFLFLALDPFHIALTRLLHLDGLSCNLLLLTVLSFLNFLDQRQRRDLVISGIAAGLAWLTRSANLILGPFVALLVLIELVRLWRGGQGGVGRELRFWVRSGLAWTGIGAAVFVLLWPAMWVSPIRTIEQMVNGSLELATEAHARQVFFAGRLFTDDPGLSFYPIVFLWRTSPVMLPGLWFAVMAFLLPRTFGIGFPHRALAQLSLFALVYGLVLTAGAKKLDRYLLPSQAALDLVAVVGWLAAARWLVGWLSTRGASGPRQLARFAAPALIALLLAAQAALAASAYPYYLDYYNPLLGGARGAREAMMVGWGEGMDVVADELEDLPNLNLEELTVSVGPWPTSLSYFLTWDRTLKPSYDDPLSKDAIRLWSTTDLRVLTFPEVQRALIPAEMLAYFRSLQPIAVTHLDGQEYVWVYDLRHAPLPEYYLQSDLPIYDFGATLRHVANWLSPTPVAPGENTRVQLYLQALTSLDRPLTVEVRLLDDAGETLATDADILTEPTESRAIWPMTLRLSVPPDTPPGDYQVALTVTDEATGDPLAAEHTSRNAAPAREVVIGTIAIGDVSRE